MGRNANFCLLACALLLMFGAALSQATEPAAHKRLASPHAELAGAAQAAVERGFHAELPPHISTLLGLTREEKCAVLQGVLRSAERIQGIDISEKNHNDIVLFTVDAATQEQTFYLTSSAGNLRRLLSVKQGVGRVVEPSQGDREAFEREKKMWEDRLTASALLAPSTHR